MESAVALIMVSAEAQCHLSCHGSHVQCPVSHHEGPVSSPRQSMWYYRGQSESGKNSTFPVLRFFPLSIISQ